MTTGVVIDQANVRGSILEGMTRKRFVKLLLAAIVVIFAVGFAARAVFGVHDVGLFELDVVDGVGDGNTVNDPAVAGDDWADVYDGTSSAFATAFIEDTFANGEVAGFEARTPEVSFFTGGGSKDTRFLQDPCPGTGPACGPWEYDTGNNVVPDKNDIVNAFAAAYDDPDDGHTIFYFGLDTYSVNGANNVGFWFFRQPVTLAPLNGNSGAGFIGEHTDGDIFVAAAFTEGGDVGTIQVYEWDDANGLVLVNPGADCATAAANDDVCGVINVTPGEVPPWGYINSSGDSAYESAAFAEFGLDVTALLGQDIGCFSTFLAETRASQSVTAQLKDFALGAFPVCGIDVEKTGDDLSKEGDDASYSITIENTGRATLYKESIIDSLVGDLTDGTNVAIDSSDCGASLAPSATCTITYHYTVTANDADPLLNTVDISYREFGGPLSGLSFEAESSHEVNLFQPSITIDKTGDALSKIGDDTGYTITVTNTSSDDTPDLTCTTNDAALGVNDVTVLASGDPALVINASAAIPAGASDPYINTADTSCAVAGFPNVLTADASHSVDLFQPSITIDKTGDALSKIGDDTGYTITVTNTSSDDTPDLTCTTTDAALGVAQVDVLASGDPALVINASAAIPAGASDPYINTADTSCAVAGFPNVLTADASHSVDLFQPSITIDKTGDALSKIGDDTGYTITVTNTSSDDTPDLTCTTTDAALGVAQVDVLASGDPALVINASAAIPAGASDPYINTADTSCAVAGFPNVLTADASHSVNLFQPSITIDKTGDALSKIGDDTGYTITVTNTSSDDTPDLTCTTTDAALGVAQVDVLASGDPALVINASAAIPAGASDPYINTADTSCAVAGFSNVLTADASHSVNLFQPSITIDKTGDVTLSKVGDPVKYTITLDNTSSADSPALECTITDTVVGVNEAVTLASSDPDHVIMVTRIVQANDPDPLVNTADVSCSPIGFPNLLEASDGHSVELFGPSITFEKTGDALSKIGDDTDYTITVTNLSSADTPDLTCTTIDAALGVNQVDVLGFGGQVVINASAAIPANADDPHINTAATSCAIAGFPNVVEASASHSVNLFQPSITLDKTGDDLSKIGDDTGYTITLTNTSSADTPNLTCTTNDAALGVAQVDVLGFDGQVMINASAAIPANASDPYTNTADTSCAVDGFPNVLTADASHDVNLFQPSIEFDKTVGNAFSKAGDTIDYTITLDNTSSVDSPNLTCTITDAVVGVNEQVVLGSGGQEVILVGYVVQVGDADPYENTANVSCSPDGFPNILDASASASVDLIHPDFTVAKVCTNEPVPQEGPATWDVTIDNTGDVELIITADDGIGTFNLPSGQDATFPVSQPGDYRGQTTVSNTVTASWVLPAPFGLDNTDEKSATADCQVGSRVELLKLTDGVVNDTFDWQFAIFDGPNEGNNDAFLGNPLATDSTLGDVDGVLDFDSLNLDPDNTYTICELATNASAGWQQVWMVNGQPATQYSVFDDQNANVGVGCIDFGAGTSYPLTAGGTLAFEVDNRRPPGGEPRTPGYWANWSSCSNGNQWTKATVGDPDNEFTALDELLQTNVYNLGLLELGILGGDPAVASPDCEDAKNILFHREITGRNKVMANDGAYKLARSLLAYELNQDAGACQSTDADAAAALGHALLDDVSFDGSGRYLRPKDGQQYQDALTYHGILDDYNNGVFCP